MKYEVVSKAEREQGWIEFQPKRNMSEFPSIVFHVTQEVLFVIVYLS